MYNESRKYQDGSDTMPTEAGQPAKKMLILNILNILRKYTDEFDGNKLSQKEIGEILSKEYNQKVDRKAIKRNLDNLYDYAQLHDFGYRVERSETIRVNEYNEEETLTYDWHLVRDITEPELRLIIDGLLFSKHIPYNQCKDLVKKLEKLAGPSFENKVKHIRTMPEKLPENRELFWTIEVLDEAIAKKRKVTFKYNDYGVDKKLHPRLSEDGTVRQYTVSPYQMAATNGRYYLICNYDVYDDVSNFRIDRISGIEMTSVSAKPMREVKGLEKGLDLPRHMAENIYMFSGQSIWVKFRADRHIISDVLDWFGRDARLTNDGDDVIANVQVSEQAMLYWALQFGQYVEVLEPLELRERVGAQARAIAERYGK